MMRSASPRRSLSSWSNKSGRCNRMTTSASCSKLLWTLMPLATKLCVPSTVPSKTSRSPMLVISTMRPRTRHCRQCVKLSVFAVRHPLGGRGLPHFLPHLFRHRVGAVHANTPKEPGLILSPIDRQMPSVAIAGIGDASDLRAYVDTQQQVRDVIDQPATGRCVVDLALVSQVVPVHRPIGGPQVTEKQRDLIVRQRKHLLRHEFLVTPSRTAVTPKYAAEMVTAARFSSSILA